MEKVQKKKCFWESTMTLGLVAMFVGFLVLPESVRFQRIPPGWDTVCQYFGCALVILGLVGTTVKVMARRRELMKELQSPKEA